MVSQSPVARYGSEFLGTFLLVFTVGCNVLVGSKTWGITSIACVLTVFIYALGAVSGAHFNPAVTLAITFAGKMESYQEAGIYICVQLLGGLCGGFLYTAVLADSFNLQPGDGYTWVNAVSIEFFYTFLLCFVVLCVACTSKTAGGNQYYGIAIGFVIIAGGHAGGHISGGCFNPAVALGIDVSSAWAGFGYSILYWGFEIGAALAAFVVFRVIHPEEYGPAAPRPGLLAKLLCEFIGTYFLVLTVGLNVMGSSKAGAWSIAAVLMSCIYAVGPVSGGHLNPAVTFALLCSGRDKVPGVGTAAAYMGVQIWAGIMAGITYVQITGAAFALMPGQHYHWRHVAFAETAFTFVLCFAVLCIASVRNPLPDLFGLAIASCVTAGGFAIGSISGGSLNPAVSFGLDFANTLKGGFFSACIFYTFFELLGAVIAVMAFYATHIEEYEDPFAEMDKVT